MKLIDDFKVRPPWVGPGLYGRRAWPGLVARSRHYNCVSYWHWRQVGRADGAQVACSKPSRHAGCSMAWRHAAPPLHAALQASWDYLGSDGTAITLHTNADAPRYRVVRGDMSTAGTPRAVERAGAQAAQGRAALVGALY